MNKTALRIILLLALLAAGVYATMNSSFFKSELSETTPVMQHKGSFAPGEILVKFKPGTPERILLSLKEKLGVQDETFIESIRVYHWKGNFDTEEAIHTLNRSRYVEYAEPNYRVEIQE